MEPRYFIAGINIVLISSILFILGLTYNMDLLKAVSASNIILGIILVTIGLSYHIPSLKYLIALLDTYTSSITKTLEDMNILNPLITLCSGDKELLVYHTGEIVCNEIMPGIGLASNKPYVSIDVSPISNVIEFKGGSLKEMLYNVLIGDLALGSRLNVQVSDNKVVIEILELEKDLVGLVSKSSNIVHMVILPLIYRVYGRTPTIINEYVRSNRYYVEVLLE